MPPYLSSCVLLSKAPKTHRKLTSKAAIAPGQRKCFMFGVDKDLSNCLCIYFVQALTVAVSIFHPQPPMFQFLSLCTGFDSYQFLDPAVSIFHPPQPPMFQFPSCVFTSQRLLALQVLFSPPWGLCYTSVTLGPIQPICIIIFQQPVLNRHFMS